MSILDSLEIPDFEKERTPGFKQVEKLLEEALDDEELLSLTYSLPHIVDTDLVPVLIDSDFTYGNQGVKVVFEACPFEIETKTRIMNIGVLH